MSLPPFWPEHSKSAFSALYRYLIFITINKSVTPVWYHIFSVMVTAVFYCPFLYVFYAAYVFYGTAFMYNHAIYVSFLQIWRLK